jgi:hypothetical protein
MLGPDIFNILFSNSLNICSSFRVRDEVTHPYKPTGNESENLGERIQTDMTSRDAMSCLKSV